MKNVSFRTCVKLKGSQPASDPTDQGLWTSCTVLRVQLTPAKSVAGRSWSRVGSPGDGEVVLDAVGGGRPGPRVRHRLVVAPLLQHELPLRGVLNLAGVAAGQDADSVVLVVQVLSPLVVERLHQAGGVKVILETSRGRLDRPSPVAEYLGDPQTPLVVRWLWSLDEELNFSLSILQGLNVEMLLVVHLTRMFNSLYGFTWMVANNLILTMMMMTKKFLMMVLRLNDDDDNFHPTKSRHTQRPHRSLDGELLEFFETKDKLEKKKIVLKNIVIYFQQESIFMTSLKMYPGWAMFANSWHFPKMFFTWREHSPSTGGSSEVSTKSTLTWSIMS